uniref:Hermansky-Pudlak syndrome 1 protein n=1 Tax=Denticeps clupeoides TaxID=299321 RepID=A0AAY3ZVW6_9TELE
MKCLLVASESAEVLFYWTDPEFELSAQEQYGASQEDGERPPAFEDSINTLFAPIIISCSTMVDQLGDSYTSFSTENNHIYVLHQFDECLYIAVNGDGEESEDDLKRKIYVLKKLTEMLFGMVTLSSTLLRKELRPQDTELRCRVWRKLQGLLETYSRLRDHDQSFLVEAVERLIHPTLCEQCIEFLERRLVQQINTSVDRAGEEVQHAFILVHTKLLAFYSSRNASTLTSSDLLALIILVQHFYPSTTDPEESTPEVSRSTFILTNDDMDSASAPEIFYTPEPSPTDNDSAELIADLFLSLTNQVAVDSLQTLEVPPQDPSTPSRVFLETTLKEGFFPMMPHSMYCLPMWPGITLVLLTKIPNSQIAMSIYNFLEGFTKLEKRLAEGQQGSPASRGQLPVNELRSKIDKFIRVLGSSDIQESVCMCCRLLPWCRNMKIQLCAIYRQCYVAEGSSRQRLSTALQDRALTMVQDKLMDWKEFLLVKSKRNITMVSYPEFPGLVHFIYIDRSAGQMIAPSLSITERATSELGKGPLAHFIKAKVWSLVGIARRYLQKGYTTVTLRDGDYFFCYFLWFENETGFKLDVVEIPSLPDDSAPIGMLACDYYRKLLRYYSKCQPSEVVKCYELLTVHLGVIPTEYILQHCSQLARKLWEPSRIPLL